MGFLVVEHFINLGISVTKRPSIIVGGRATPCGSNLFSKRADLAYSGRTIEAGLFPFSVVSIAVTEGRSFSPEEAIYL
jgi:hypothetical protein